MKRQEFKAYSGGSIDVIDSYEFACDRAEYPYPIQLEAYSSGDAGAAGVRLSHDQARALAHHLVCRSAPEKAPIGQFMCSTGDGTSVVAQDDDGRVRIDAGFIGEGYALHHAVLLSHADARALAYRILELADEADRG